MKYELHAGRVIYRNGEPLLRINQPIAGKTAPATLDAMARKITFMLDARYKVVELALCEQEHLILKPDVLYSFTAHEHCKKCQEIKEAGAVK